MRAAALLVGVVAGCSPPSEPYSPGIDAGPYVPPPCTAPGPVCGGAQCGNSVIDSCFVRGGQPRTCQWIPSVEACDGANVPSCTDLGYFGGATSCSNCTDVATANCEACAPTDIACVAYSPYEIKTPFVNSGSRVAVGNWWYVEGVNATLSVFDGASELSRTRVPEVVDIATIPTGWLVAIWTSPTDPMTLTPLAFDGTLGTPKPLPSNITPYRLSSGPPDRILLTWLENDINTNGSFLRTAFADANGNVVAGPAAMFVADQYGVTSDGTSFFVGGRGSVARVASDGALTINTGFPIGGSLDAVTLVWSGTQGWYIQDSYLGVTAQRFDATGAPVSAPFAIAAAKKYIADGTDLFAVRHNPAATHRIEIIRIDATGNLVGSPIAVGAGGYQLDLVRVGTNLFVTWKDSETLHVALVAP